MSIFNQTEVVKIDLAQSTGEDNIIQERVIECVKDIISMVRDEYGTDYEDNTYRQLYIMSQDFSKRIAEILLAENINAQPHMEGDVSEFTPFLR